MMGLPVFATSDDRLMITPLPPASRMRLANSWHRKNGARALTANVRSKSCGVVSKKVFPLYTPAMFTSTRRTPYLRVTSSTSAGMLSTAETSHWT